MSGAPLGPTGGEATDPEQPNIGGGAQPGSRAAGSSGPAAPSRASGPPSEGTEAARRLSGAAGFRRSERLLRSAARGARRGAAALPPGLAWASDTAVSALLRRPVEVRLRATPWDLARGRVREVRIGLGGVTVAGLDLDRVALRLREVRLRPGLHTVASAGSVVAEVSVTEAALGRWTDAVSLPVKLRLAPGRIIARAGVAGVRLGQVDMRLGVNRGFLWLTPKRFGLLGLAAPNLAGDLLSVPLPMPSLPAGARLSGIDIEQGRARLSLEVGPVERDLTPAVVARLGDRLADLARPAPPPGLQPPALPAGPSPV